MEASNNLLSIIRNNVTPGDNRRRHRASVNVEIDPDNILDNTDIGEVIVQCSFSQYWSVIRRVNFDNILTLQKSDMNSLMSDLSELRANPGLNKPHNPNLEMMVATPEGQEIVRLAGIESSSYITFSGIKAREYKFCLSHLLKMYSNMMAQENFQFFIDSAGQYWLCSLNDNEAPTPFDVEHLVQKFTEILPTLATKKYRSVKFEDILLNAGYFEVAAMVTSSGFKTLIKKNKLRVLNILTTKMILKFGEVGDYETEKLKREALAGAMANNELDECFPGLPALIDQAGAHIADKGSLIVQGEDTEIVPLSLLGDARTMAPIVRADIVPEKLVMQSVAQSAVLDGMVFITDRDLSLSDHIEDDDGDGKDSSDNGGFETVHHDFIQSENCLTVNLAKVLSRDQSLGTVLIDATKWRERGSAKEKNVESVLVRKAVQLCQDLWADEYYILVDITKMSTAPNVGLEVNDIKTVYLPLGLYMVRVHPRFTKAPGGVFSAAFYRSLMAIQAEAYSHRMGHFLEMCQGDYENLVCAPASLGMWESFRIIVPEMVLKMAEPDDNDAMDAVQLLLQEENDLDEYSDSEDEFDGSSDSGDYFSHSDASSSSSSEDEPEEVSISPW